MTTMSAPPPGPRGSRSSGCRRSQLWSCTRTVRQLPGHGPFRPGWRRPPGSHVHGSRASPARRFQRGVRVVGRHHNGDPFTVDHRMSLKQVASNPVHHTALAGCQGIRACCRLSFLRVVVPRYFFQLSGLCRCSGSSVVLSPLAVSICSSVRCVCRREASWRFVPRRSARQVRSAEDRPAEARLAEVRTG